MIRLNERFQAQQAQVKLPVGIEIGGEVAGLHVFLGLFGQRLKCGHIVGAM